MSLIDVCQLLNPNIADVSPSKRQWVFDSGNVSDSRTSGIFEVQGRQVESVIDNFNINSDLLEIAC